MEKELKTKIQIAEAMKELCKKKPLRSVTVKDIIDACEINRSTFYYHFPDKHGLMEWIFENDITSHFIKARERMWVNNTEHLLNVFYEDSSFYSQAVKSDMRDTFEILLFQATYVKAKEFFDTIVEKAREQAERYEFAARFYSYAFTGMYMEYIASGAKTKPSEEATRFYDLIEPYFSSTIQHYFTHV